MTGASKRSSAHTRRRAGSGQKEGVAAPIIEKIGADVSSLKRDLASIIEGKPSVSGDSAEPYFSKRMREALTSAQKEVFTFFTQGVRYGE